MFYGGNIAGAPAQSVVVGQQIALSVGQPPSGITILSQFWSRPPGTPIGGYNASTGNGGSVVPLAASLTASMLTFYWADPGNSRQVTLTWTLSNGQSNSATATFNVAAPTGVNVNAVTTSVNILPPPNYIGTTLPAMAFTSGSQNGIMFTASSTPPPGNAGTYSWTQLLKTDQGTKLLNTGVTQNCTTFSGPSDSPELDSAVPYPYISTVGGVTNNSSADSPGGNMLSTTMEYTRTFSATMFLLWIPNADSRCTGSACVIPVPLGYTNWGYTGDAINTLTTQGNGTNWSLGSCHLNSQDPAFQASNWDTGCVGVPGITSCYPSWTYLDTAQTSCQ